MKKIVLFLSMLLLFNISFGNEFHIEKKLNVDIPTFVLKDLDGKTTESKNIFKNGKKTLFILAAEWCPHCRAELPEVQKFYEKYKDKVNVVVVFLGSSSLEEVKGYVSNSKFTFPIYYDDDNSILEGFDIQSVPFNFKISNNRIEGILELPVNYDSLVKSF
nr:TlpA disulfide reductase family protein [uncultured Leptotrichia sp.]